VIAAVARLFAGSEEEPLLRATGLSLAGLVAFGGTRLAFSVVVGRTFGPTELGRVGVALSLVLLASLFASGGTAPAASKFAARSLAASRPHEAAGITALLGKWTILGTAAAVAVVAAASPWLLPGSSGASTFAVLTLLAAYAAYTFTKGILYGAGLIKQYAGLEIATAGLALLMTGIVVVVYRQPVLLPLIAGYASFSIVAWRLRPRSDSRVVDRPLRREARSFVRLAVLGTVASSGFLQLSMVFANASAAADEAGYYAAALSLIGPAYLVPRALSMALFPSMARSHGKGEKLIVAQKLDTSTRLLAIGTIPLFAAAVFLSGPIVQIFFGSRFTGGEYVLVLLLTATLVSILPIPSANSLSAGAPRYVGVSAWASAAGLVFGLAFWVLLARGSGVIPIAIGYLTGSLIQAGVPMAFAYKVYEVPWRTLAARLGVAALLGITGEIWIAADPSDNIRRGALVIAFALIWTWLNWTEVRTAVVAGRRALLPAEYDEQPAC
jgi:O-antigen/teichoic acid export membrane protein